MNVSFPYSKVKYNHTLYVWENSLVSKACATCRSLKVNTEVHSSDSSEVTAFALAMQLCGSIWPRSWTPFTSPQQMIDSLVPLSAHDPEANLENGLVS